MSSSLSSAPTSAATLLSADHGRMRRAQRLIEKRDLKAAGKHGTRESSPNPRGELNWKYTYADVIYITDSTSKHEITCWAAPGAGLDVAKHKITPEMKRAHQQASALIKARQDSWTSHTVIIVDQSGSMRKTDVDGGSTRSDAVWLTVAVDFVAKQLETGKSSDTDVVSVVAMCSESTIVIDRQPHDWLLFNRLVDLLRSQEPHFDGNYMPALDAAERLLLSNTYGSCALTLFFLSDGKPSDKVPRGVARSVGSSDPVALHSAVMGERIDDLASRFGRRLTVICVGFAAPSEDFRILENLAARPAEFGSMGRFFAARLNPEALGTAFSSITSSLNATKTELTEIGGSSQRAVRDVRRRARDAVGRDSRPNENWLLYSFDRREWNGQRKVYAVHKRGFLSKPPLDPSACAVAMTAEYFGEGAERIVREFREVGLYGKFVGPPLVAKESRFQSEAGMRGRDVLNYHRAFCDTQQRAQNLATVFNKRLLRLCDMFGYDPARMPKIEFLECSVYAVQDETGEETGMLVEKLLDPAKYKKWNDNCGFVDGQGPDAMVAGDGALEAIMESDEDADDSEDESQSEDDDEIRIADIPQAFSHFTYRYTKRKVLVCDLQGVLSSNPPKFEFTDPVIHFSSRSGRRNVFGRTDRGKKGMHDFFKTHKCTPLCRMLQRRWVKQVGEKQRHTHLDGLEEQVSNLTIGEHGAGPSCRRC